MSAEFRRFIVAITHALVRAGFLEETEADATVRARARTVTDCDTVLDHSPHTGTHENGDVGECAPACANVRDEGGQRAPSCAIVPPHPSSPPASPSFPPTPPLSSPPPPVSAPPSSAASALSRCSSPPTRRPSGPHQPDLFPGASEVAPIRSPTPSELLQRWNAIAAELGLPKSETLTPKRRLDAALRIREGLFDRWDEFAAALRVSRFHLGENDLGWRADFTWLLRPGKWLCVIERVAVPERPVTLDLPNGNASARRPLSRAERNKAEIDKVDWDAIDRERAELGLDREEGEPAT